MISKAVNDYLIGIHCLAHRLALASKHSFAAVPYLDTIEQLLRSVNQYFCRSNKRVAILSALQRKLDLPVLIVKRYVETRWLSRYDVVSRIIDNYPALLAFFTEEVNDKELTEIQRQSAKEIFSLLREWRTLAWLLFLVGVLRILSEMWYLFQKKDANIVNVTDQLRAFREKFNLSYKPNSSMRVPHEVTFRSNLKYWIACAEKRLERFDLKYQFDNDNPSTKLLFICNGVSEIDDFENECALYCKAINTELDKRFYASETLDALAKITALKYPAIERPRQSHEIIAENDIDQNDGNVEEETEVIMDIHTDDLSDPYRKVYTPASVLTL